MILKVKFKRNFLNVNREVNRDIEWNIKIRLSLEYKYIKYFFNIK